MLIHLKLQAHAGYKLQEIQKKGIATNSIIKANLIYSPDLEIFFS